MPARPTAALLAGWRRVAMREMLWPTLRRNRAGRVSGARLQRSAAALAHLKVFEKPIYARRWVVVTTARGKTAAFAWIAPFVWIVLGATRRPWTRARDPRRTPS